MGRQIDAFANITPQCISIIDLCQEKSLLIVDLFLSGTCIAIVNHNWTLLIIGTDCIIPKS